MRIVNINFIWRPKTPLNKETLKTKGNLVLNLLEIKEKAKRLEMMLSTYYKMCICYKILHERGALISKEIKDIV